MDLASLMLWALVIALGIQTGAGLFETRVLIPLWSSSPPESVVTYHAQALRPDSGRRFWIFLTPLVGLISALNLIVAWQSEGPRRAWWLLGAGASTAVIIVTFTYFVPVLLRLLRAGEMPATEVAGMVRWWVRLNWLRAVVLMAAWLAALKAFSYGA